MKTTLKVYFENGMMIEVSNAYSNQDSKQEGVGYHEIIEMEKRYNSRVKKIKVRS